jgi:GWxTD domain-containing protein
MRQRKKYIICIILLGFLYSCKSYEKAGGVNMISRFNLTAFDLPAVFTLQHVTNDSTRIYIHLPFHKANNLIKPTEYFTLTAMTMKDIGDADRFIWPPHSERLINTFTLNAKRDTTISITVPINRNDYGWLQVRLYAPDSSIYIRRMLPFDKAHSGNQAFYHITNERNEVIHPAYLHTGSSYFIKHFSSADSLIAERFSFYSTPAAPIFFQNAHQGLPVERDTLFRFATADPIQFDSPGFYEIRRPFDSIGLQLLVHNGNFPELETAEDLIEPLRYISRNDEYQKLRKAQDFKLQLDSFWLARCGSMNVARQSIKLYYNRVEFSNRLFSTYRAGWKTDPGLVYIMFGAPQKCYQFKAGEIWTYTNLPSQTEFVFTERHNERCSYWLELRREQDYINFWNGQSYKWRTGKMISESP